MRDENAVVAGALVLLFVIVAILFLISGCAQHYYTKDGAMPADFEQVKAQCEYEQEARISASPDVLFTAFETGRLLDSCMRAKGWRRVER